MLYSASAPGSLMLLGEYAVLTGKPALVCAINKRIKVSLQPRLDKKILLFSNIGNYATEISKLEIEPPFQFVLASIKKFQKFLKNGCDITIAADFSDKVGFASSAAVTVATIVTLYNWLKIPYTSLDLVKLGRKVIRKVQGIGSGADVAACVYGGIIYYEMQPLKIEVLPHNYPLTVIYSGIKTKTSAAIAIVKNNFQNKLNILNNLNTAISNCVLEAKNAITTENWIEVGKIMNVQQGIMDALGVNTESLNIIINALRQDKNILGAKISGSGLGDCVVALGANAVKIKDYLQIPVEISTLGVQCEEN